MELLTMTSIKLFLRQSTANGDNGLRTANVPSLAVEGTRLGQGTARAPNTEVNVKVTRGGTSLATSTRVPFTANGRSGPDSETVRSLATKGSRSKRGLVWVRLTGERIVTESRS